MSENFVTKLYNTDDGEDATLSQAEIRQIKADAWAEGLFAGWGEPVSGSAPVNPYEVSR